MSNDIIPPGGLRSLKELDDFEVVRSEFLAPLFRPKIILDVDSVAFNASCVRLLPNTTFIQFLTRREEKRLVLQACGAYDKDAYQWSRMKNDKLYPRKAKCKFFGYKIFDMMNWIPENRYKVQAVYQVLEGKQLLVFNLTECEMVVPEEVVLDNGRTITRRIAYCPVEWRDRFGMTYREHQESTKLDLNAQYMISNASSGEQSLYAFTERELQGREPTARELVTREYRPKERKKQP